MSVKVSQLIGRGIISVDSSTPIREAVKVMANNNIGFLVIMNSGKMVGVVSERDVIRAIAKGVDLGEPIINISTRNIITVNANASIYEAADLMHRFNIRHLVVTDESGSPIGVLSIRDVISEVVVLRNMAMQSSVGITEEQPAPHTD